MREVLFDYFFTRFQVLAILLFAGSAVCVLFWALRRRWQSDLETLTHKLADCQIQFANLQNRAAELEQELVSSDQKVAALEEKLEHCDPERVESLHEQLQSFFGHEITDPLDDIKRWSSLALEEVKNGQDVLRRQHRKNVDRASRALQRVINVKEAFEPEKPVKKPLLDLRLFIEVMLRDDFLSFAAVNDVTPLTTLADVEPTLLSDGLTSTTLGNVIHNAIKYSRPGGVVEIVLTVETGVLEGVEKALCIDVKNIGDTIPEDLQGNIFDLWHRGAGPIKKGQGLGLYLARRAARRQGGDLILVHSNSNQGTVFRVLLPYGGT